MTLRAMRQDAAAPIGKASAAAVAWRYRGELRVTAMIKVTFAFAPDAAMTRVEPEAIAVNDRVPYLKRADVTFTGGAGVPAGAQVGLAIAGGARPLLDKTAVAGAAGGAPLGPVPRHASLPTLGAHVTEIPSAFDWDLFQAAPADQRTDYLRGDEWIVLEGLHPLHAELRTRLPGGRAHARIYGLAAWRIADGAALAMNADVLHVRGDEARCTVTWRGSFALPDEAALPAVRVAVSVELPGEPIAWPDRVETLWEPEPAAGARFAGTVLMSEGDAPTVAASRDAAGATGWTLDKLLKSTAERRPGAAPLQPMAERRGGHEQTVAAPGGSTDASRSPVLPFAEGSGAPPVIAREEPRPRAAAPRVGEGTVAIPDGSPRPATLPFEKNAPAKRRYDQTVAAPGGSTDASRSPVLPFAEGSGALPAIARAEPRPRPAAPRVGEETVAIPGGSPRPATLPFEKNAPPETRAPEPPPPAAAQAPPAAKAPAKEHLVSSAASDAPPPPKAPEKKLPPKVNVANKLYGAGKRR